LSTIVIDIVVNELLFEYFKLLSCIALFNTFGYYCK